jgi:hypothetical protein
MRYRSGIHEIEHHRYIIQLQLDAVRVTGSAGVPPVMSVFARIMGTERLLLLGK